MEKIPVKWALIAMSVGIKMKKMMFLSSAAILLILSLAGCATSYQPNGINGGYTDMALNENTYFVSFNGNRYTSSEITQSYALRRSAELTLNKGYAYFVVMNQNTAVSSQVVQTPETIDTQTASDFSQHHENSTSHTTIQPSSAYAVNSYKSGMTIRMLHSNQDYPQAYDAAVILSNYH